MSTVLITHTGLKLVSRDGTVTCVHVHVFTTVYFSDILDITLSKMKEGVHQEENRFLISPKFICVALGGEPATSRSNTGEVHLVLG